MLEVAGNSDAVILSGLEADTQYQVTVAALWGGHKYRSRPIVFRTLGKCSSALCFAWTRTVVAHRRPSPSCRAAVVEGRSRIRFQFLWEKVTQEKFFHELEILPQGIEIL